MSHSKDRRLAVGCQNYIRIWMGHAASLWGLAGEDGELLAEGQVLKDEMSS